MNSTNTETVVQAQARAWCILYPYATMAKQEFDALTLAEQMKLPLIAIMLDYVEGCTCSLCEMANTQGQQRREGVRT